MKRKMSLKRTFSTATQHLQKQSSIPASYYRGGTSKALIFNAHHLPRSRAEWTPIFLGTIGSPDPNGRQLDGMGGGISSLSKICVVSPSDHRKNGGADAQVDFTFVQVGIRDRALDYEGNCGNMTAAIGPFAVDSGLVQVSPSDSISDGSDRKQQQTVELYNTNTNKVIHVTFPVSSDGEAAVASGSFSIDGVAGAGAKIQLDFIDPAGSKTGSLLPTGNKVDVIGGIRATCIDVGNPCIFVPAWEVLSEYPGVNVKGTILPDEIQNQQHHQQQQPSLLSKLESIRKKATMKMGMAKSLNEVPPSIPKICLVSPPSSHKLSSGEVMDGNSVDVIARAISTGQPHKALPITSGLALSAAARMAGTVVSECLREKKDGDGGNSSTTDVVIGHPSGRLLVGATYGDEGKGDLEKVTVFRTARRLMDGIVYWK